MESAQDFYDAKALLEWQIEIGADEAIAESPVNRFELAKPAPKPRVAMDLPAEATLPPADPVADATRLASVANDLQSLRDALVAFDQCELKRGAKSTVFSDGNAKARVMIIGEAPGRDEDIEGRPFVGRAGKLLDKMLAAIDLSRSAAEPESAAYITNILPWRPPQNRDPKPEEIAMMLPFVKRHVELVGPDVLILMGNISCQAVLGRKGITRLRGQWVTGWDLPILPMFHPAYLLRNPAAKKNAWADLLTLRSRLRGNT